MHNMNWDNLRYVLMVANKGSIAAAARELEVNRTTVLRRIDQFQRSLNCRLFDRSENGYVLTPEADDFTERTYYDLPDDPAAGSPEPEGNPA